MSAVIYSTPKFTTAAPAAQQGASKKGFFARLLDAIISARMEQAEREVLKYVQVPGGRYPLQ